MQGEGKEWVNCVIETAVWWHQWKRRTLMPVISPHWDISYHIKVTWAPRVMRWKGIKEYRTEWRLQGEGMDSYIWWTRNVKVNKNCGSRYKCWGIKKEEQSWGCCLMTPLWEETVRCRNTGITIVLDTQMRNFSGTKEVVLKWWEQIFIGFTLFKTKLQ